MGIRVAIQTRIINLINNGTFKAVTYTGDLPVLSETPKAPSSVICNETNGGISGSSKIGAVGQSYVLTGWRFEAKAKFDCEVEVDYFLLNELENLNFSLDGVLIKVVPSGDFRVTHPPRNASHNGTELVIGLTATTRR